MPFDRRDLNRNDMPVRYESDDSDYTENQRELLIRWRRAAVVLAEEHSDHASNNKKWHYRLMIPTLVIPVIMAPLESLASGGEWLAKLNVGAFIATGVFSGLSIFFKHAEKEAQHEDAVVGYKEIILAVDTELTKPGRVREPIEMFVQRLQMKLQFLAHTSPSINAAPLLRSALSYEVQATSVSDIEKAETAVSSKKKARFILRTRGIYGSMQDSAIYGKR
jgi:hypothetical protein